MTYAALFTSLPGAEPDAVDTAATDALAAAMASSDVVLERIRVSMQSRTPRLAPGARWRYDSFFDTIAEYQDCAAWRSRIEAARSRWIDAHHEYWLALPSAFGPLVRMIAARGQYAVSFIEYGQEGHLPSTRLWLVTDTANQTTDVLTGEVSLTLGDLSICSAAWVAGMCQEDSATESLRIVGSLDAVFGSHRMVSLGQDTLSNELAAVTGQGRVCTYWDSTPQGWVRLRNHKDLDHQSGIPVFKVVTDCNANAYPSRRTEVGCVRVENVPAELSESRLA